MLVLTERLPDDAVPLLEHSREFGLILLNDISTLVVGNVGLDPDLDTRLATDDKSSEDVANRLRPHRRGEWLVTLPSASTRPIHGRSSSARRASGWAP